MTEDRAREMLAAEVRKFNRPITADGIEDGSQADYMTLAALCAIEKALQSADQVMAEERERCARVADAYAEIWEVAAATIAGAIRSAPSRSGGGEGRG